ncbi:MAG: archaemetzincin family Zn-dependent metalloprotease [Deltaproteobacteria bacterium]|nr:archaemetzincin family Zn-dependent metalloprotease [Deltaproteobacteria bacterium]
MTEKQRAPRRRFDTGSFAPEEYDSTDLPLEPLPPEPQEGPVIRPADDAAIALIPIGNIDERLIRSVVSPLGAAFGRAVSVLKPLPVPKYAFNPSRAQYHSAAILKRVETMRNTDWDSAVGVVDVDLFVPEVPFIFGEADRSTRAAIVSISRLRSDVGSQESRFEALSKRLLSESIHQMGLIRGLAHCPNNRCVMFLSSTVQDTDKKGVQFCANCRKRLLTEM